MNKIFDVIVVGGGHAGVEAAYAAAKMGSKTLLLTLDPNKIAAMPCNPSIGGLGKGHIVFEVSAFGGLIPQLCSKAYLQARMLNTSKGPAVQGLRVQIDKYVYSAMALKHLNAASGLTIITDMVVRLLTTVSNGRTSVIGVVGSSGAIYNALCVIVTVGTFLNGTIHIGRVRYPAGRRDEASVSGLSESLSTAMSVPMMRLKTGTPPRLLSSSLDYSPFVFQPSDELDYLYEFNHQKIQERAACYVAHTNEKTHDIIRNHLHLSALYSGNITGSGPRYCPSIEDKVGRYPERGSHHVFIEPEGINSLDIYPAGLSTSLPLEVQYAYIRSIRGCENAIITKCGYAIEYDAFQPNNLTHSLEAKAAEGLFLAGQINGTTGYEEAAGQGLMAGINAHLKHTGQPPFILSRSESYIGVMIDDLVTLGASEPYRMFTSRAERRLLLRQDNVFIRLAHYAHTLGLITDDVYTQCEQEKKLIQNSVDYLLKNKATELFRLFFSIHFSQDIQQQCRQMLCDILNCPADAISSRALLCIHAEIRYEGYLVKEHLEVEKAKKYSTLILPATLSYDNMPGLSKELQNKLTCHRPETIAQAQLIPGMTPAAISILIFQTRQNNKN
jgi:tRNA uridine 5-carboxymethylaminomethyl modification enzyme